MIQRRADAIGTGAWAWVGHTGGGGVDKNTPRPQNSVGLACAWQDLCGHGRARPISPYECNPTSKIHRGARQWSGPHRRSALYEAQRDMPHWLRCGRILERAQLLCTKREGKGMGDARVGPRADKGDGQVVPRADNGDEQVELHADKDATTWGQMRAGQRTKMRPYDDPGDMGAGCSPDNGDERVGLRVDKGDGWLGSHVEKGDEQMGPRADKGDGRVESSANKDDAQGGHLLQGRCAGTNGSVVVYGMHYAVGRHICHGIGGCPAAHHGSPQQTFVVRCFNA
ncbi:hypothetical protein B0H14DRAFT_2652047 [Mycena olivaceomarginata]|nr:hypothetical protein B0H14DRAFT_2652047 [Mycena olivaceomarginata]